MWGSPRHRVVFQGSAYVTLGRRLFGCFFTGLWPRQRVRSLEFQSDINDEKNEQRETEALRTYDVRVRVRRDRAH
jgi:hypothetical protein